MDIVEFSRELYLFYNIKIPFHQEYRTVLKPSNLIRGVERTLGHFCDAFSESLTLVYENHLFQVRDKDEELLSYAIPRCLKLVDDETYYFSFMLVAAFIAKLSLYLESYRHCYRFTGTAYKCLAAVFKRRFQDTFEEKGSWRGLCSFCDKINCLVNEQKLSNENLIRAVTRFDYVSNEQVLHLIRECDVVEDISFPLNIHELSLVAADDMLVIEAELNNFPTSEDDSELHIEMKNKTEKYFQSFTRKKTVSSASKREAASSIDDTPVCKAFRSDSGSTTSADYSPFQKKQMNETYIEILEISPLNSEKATSSTCIRDPLSSFDEPPVAWEVVTSDVDSTKSIHDSPSQKEQMNETYIEILNISPLNSGKATSSTCMRDPLSSSDEPPVASEVVTSDVDSTKSINDSPSQKEKMNETYIEILNVSPLNSGKATSSKCIRDPLSSFDEPPVAWEVVTSDIDSTKSINDPPSQKEEMNEPHIEILNDSPLNSEKATSSTCMRDPLSSSDEPPVVWNVFRADSESTMSTDGFHLVEEKSKKPDSEELNLLPCTSAKAKVRSWVEDTRHSFDSASPSWNIFRSGGELNDFLDESVFKQIKTDEPDIEMLNLLHLTPEETGTPTCIPNAGSSFDSPPVAGNVAKSDDESTESADEAHFQQENTSDVDMASCNSLPLTPEKTTLPACIQDAGGSDDESMKSANVSPFPKEKTTKTDIGKFSVLPIMEENAMPSTFIREAVDSDEKPLLVCKAASYDEALLLCRNETSVVSGKNYSPNFQLVDDDRYTPYDYDRMLSQQVCNWCNKRCYQLKKYFFRQHMDLMK